MSYFGTGAQYGSKLLRLGILKPHCPLIDNLLGKQKVPRLPRTHRRYQDALHVYPCAPPRHFLEVKGEDRGSARRPPPHLPICLRVHTASLQRRLVGSLCHRSVLVGSQRDMMFLQVIHLVLMEAFHNPEAGRMA